MIDRRGMNDVGGPRPRHVAADAVILAAPLPTDRRRQPAAAIGVTLQATVPVIAHPLLRGRQPMRIVAGDATEPAVTGAEATALVHLLDLADEPIRRRARRLLEHRPDPIKGQSGPEILIATVELHHALVAQQMTLLADAIPERGLQRSGVDDRQIPAVDDAGTIHMPLTRPMTPLAADRVVPEDRRLISVDRPVYRLDPVGVTVQARGDDHPVEVGVVRLVARRQVPTPLLGIPTDR